MASGRKSYVAFRQEVVHNIRSQHDHFKKEHILKALSATGYKDQEDVISWLYSHENDPTLDHQFQREYILFLCPTGPLLSEVSRFYEQSFKTCGSNAAHNLFPHITLSSFFKVGDATLAKILDTLFNIIHRSLPNQPAKLKLVLQHSDSYIGLFFNDAATSWLADVINEFVQKVQRDLDVLINPHDRKFHLTLAYNFDYSKTEDLENLATKINVDAHARWELNVYSRDPRVNGKQTQIAVHDFKANQPNELSLLKNSYIIMESEQSTHKGWKKGTEFETGKMGYYPENYTKKTAEWRIWTKNFSLPMCHSSDKLVQNNHSSHRSQSVKLKRDRKDQLRNSLRSSRSPTDESDDNKISVPSSWEPVIRTSIAIDPKIVNHVRQYSSDSNRYTPTSEQRHKAVAIQEDENSVPIKPKQELDRKVSGRDAQESSSKLVSKTLNQMQALSTSEPTRLFFMRHAERVDLTFGHDWFQLYIDKKGYHRRNLNLPRRIPTRRGGPHDFFMDGPISEIGTYQSKLIGEALRAKGVSFSQIFSSPSLRSVQTATSVLEGLMDTHTKIKLEPALFEWTAWCRNTLPKFMTANEYIDYGLNIDRSYSPFYSLSQFNLHEKTDEYYYRSKSFIDSVLKNNAKGNILMIGHSATLDVCTRQLTGNPIRKTDDLIRVVQKVPFCGICVAEEQSNRSWKLIQAPIPSLAHGQNHAFDWRVLETTASGPPYGR